MASASQRDQVSDAAQPAAAADDGASQRRPRSAAAPWSMPLKLLPLPKAFSCAGSSKRIDMRSKSYEQLMELASRHNRRQGIKEDPFETTLKGIAERAELRSTSQLAATHTLGSVPPDSPYAKAWARIKRKAVKTAAKGKGTEDAAAKRAEAAATAARLARLAGKALQEGGGPGRAQPRQQQQQELPPEQVRWRSKLAAFLGRPLQLPQLAPDAPVLDLNRLFLEVMSQGGVQAVTRSAGWQTLALNLQRDSALADELAAVYSCYLLPLEQDLPWEFRPARNLDHLETRTQQRASMGPRLASHDAVAYTWQRALAALERVLPWAAELAPGAVQQQQPAVQQQQQEGVPHASPVADGAAAEAKQQQQQQQQQGVECSQLVRDALLLLRQAAVQPGCVLQQLQEHSIAPGLHAASCKACISQIGRGYATRRKVQSAAAAASAENEWWVEDERAAMLLFAREQAALEAAAAAAAAAGVAQKGGAAAAAAGKGRRRSVNPAEQAQQLDLSSPQPAATAVAAVDEVVPTDAAATAAAEPSASCEPTAAADSGSSQQQQQQHSIAPNPSMQLDAVQWLLLSRRAVLSGPPGCNRPPLQLSGVTQPALGFPAAAAAGGSEQRFSSASGGSSSGALAGKRAFHGVTPKCGACQTCSNPSMKKACTVNRDRLAQGLPPLLAQSGAAAAAADDGAAGAKGRSKQA